MGGARPRHPQRGGTSASTGRSSAGEAARRHPRGSLRRASTRRSAPSSRRTGRQQLDASLLLLPRWASCRRPTRASRHDRGNRTRARRRRLRAPLRHRADRRGLPPGEGAFLACSFWLADATRCTGRHDEARHCSSACSRFATTSGCCPRNTTSRARRLVGNFPQAFSHIALVTPRTIWLDSRSQRNNARPRPHAASAPTPPSPPLSPPPPPPLSPPNPPLLLLSPSPSLPLPLLTHLSLPPLHPLYRSLPPRLTPHSPPPFLFLLPIPDTLDLPSPQFNHLIP